MSDLAPGGGVPNEAGDDMITTETELDLKQFVEGGDGISIIRSGGSVRGWNGIRYRAGLSAKNVGATKLSMNVATIPPGGVAYAHIHVDFEVMLYILQGHVRHEYGPGLKKVIENQAGDFIFIEPGVPHEVFNMSDVEPVVAVVARSDASEWENIVPYDRKTE
ncbi:MAG TPA: cupin domain-containing protein [Gemmatimonadaceae bacterium]